MIVSVLFVTILMLDINIFFPFFKRKIRNPTICNMIHDTIRFNPFNNLHHDSDFQNNGCRVYLEFIGSHKRRETIIRGKTRDRLTEE